jgi:hypothetical protein
MAENRNDVWLAAGLRTPFVRAVVIPASGDAGGRERPQLSGLGGRSPAREPE